jgi:hypothetical protein
MAVKDIVLTKERDLKVEAGDFAIAESDKQHVDLILKTYLGAWKEFPLVGVGLDLYLASSGMEQIIQRNITVQLQADGYKVEGVKVNPQNPTDYFINAQRQL